MDDVTFARLEAQDWANLAVRLERYALMKVQRLSWFTGRGANPNLPKGQGPEDLAFEAISRIWEGVRSWDPEKEPDVFKVLCGTVDSLVYHLLHSPEHKKRKNQLKGDILHNFPDPGDGRDSDEGWEQGILPDLPDPDPGRDGDESWEHRFLCLALDAVADDPELLKVFELCYDGLGKAADIAEAMSIPVERVYRLKEKMKRRLTNLRAVVEKGQLV